MSEAGALQRPGLRLIGDLPQFRVRQKTPDTFVVFAILTRAFRVSILF